MDDAKEAIETLSAEMVRSFTEKGLMAATAESCTGGLVAGAALYLVFLAAFRRAN